MTHDILEVRHGAIEHMQRLDDIDLHVERRQLLRTAGAVRDARLRHEGTQAHHLVSCHGHGVGGRWGVGI